MTTDTKNKRIGHFFIIIMYLLVFQNLLQNYIGIFQYFDEFLAILLFPYMLGYLMKTKNWKVKKYDFIIIISLILIFCIGMYSNLKYKYQPISVAISDALLVYKFFLVYYLFNIINKKNVLHNYSNLIIKNLKIITIILSILTILNYAFNLFPYQYRYGIMANRLFYSHPTYLAAICIFILCAMIYFKGKINSIYTYILAIIILTTLRMKAIGFLAIFVLIVLFVKKRNKRITFSKLAVLGLICAALVYNQIEYYFFTTTDSARSALLTTSIEIANDYAPFGTGFGTFASHFSAEVYSPIYEKYGIENIYGLQKNNTSFISDSFWPMILGQFGYLGLILYCICLICIFKKIQINYSSENKNIYMAKIIVLVYLLISSTSESAFVNPIAIPLAIILGL